MFLFDVFCFPVLVLVGEDLLDSLDESLVGEHEGGVGHQVPLIFPTSHIIYFLNSITVSMMDSNRERSSLVE